MCHRKMVNGRVASVKTLVNARGLQLKCARVLQELMLMPLMVVIQ